MRNLCIVLHIVAAVRSMAGRASAAAASKQQLHRSRPFRTPPRCRFMPAPHVRHAANSPTVSRKQRTVA